MQDYEKLGAFYLGRLRDAASERAGNELLLYDSRDLLTHAVCVGMTGSGKTGLCIDLLEEAAIDGIPAIAIDPKGDIANLLLQFPALHPDDFKPWLEAEEAKRQNLTLDQLAENQAEQWRKGLADWGQSPERIQRLRDAADFAIYTPGSTAGLPLSLLKSFAAPAGAAAEDRELVRDRVNGTATAVLSLLGIDAEPMKSREHILLANIFDHAWQEGRSLTIENLIESIQQPPIQRVGVMDIEAFFPAKQRFELAMTLNNLLASPGFDSWLHGDPLDVGRLLYTSAGKPRVSILSISHLSDAERMFFVTLVLNEVLNWTRSQPGTTSLRAIFYMDEIFGYFPPVANPPSRKPLLTLLKQARAFGVGVVLATQNPVDLDYRGLSNTGTWFIGRLQTERDKQRLMDGLEGALNESGAAFDRAATERTLAGLGRRVFLMNNVHDSGPTVFESRWALSYLRGPLTRSQIRTLTKSRTPDTPDLPAPVPAGTPAANTAASSARRPAIPPEVPQAFIPVRAAEQAVLYQPVILGYVQIRFLDTRSQTDFMKDSVFLTPVHDDAMPVEWEQSLEADLDPNELEREPVPGAQFAALPQAAASAKSYARWTKDLATWIYGHQALNIYACRSLQITSQPNESEGEFRVRLQQAAREQRDVAMEKLRSRYQTKLTTIDDRVRRATHEVEREREEASAHTMGTVLDVGAGVLGALFGRRRLTTAAATGMRRATRAYRQSGEVGRAQERLEAALQQKQALDDQITQETQHIRNELDTRCVQLETVGIKPKKANIQVRLLTLAWAPYTADSAGKLTPAWV